MKPPDTEVFFGQGDIMGTQDRKPYITLDQLPIARQQELGAQYSLLREGRGALAALAEYQQVLSAERLEPAVVYSVLQRRAVEEAGLLPDGNPLQPVLRRRADQYSTLARHAIIYGDNLGGRSGTDKAERSPVTVIEFSFPPSGGGGAPHLQHGKKVLMNRVR